MTNSSRTILITGASSGIGLAAAKHFALMGDTVYGLSRHPVKTEGVVPLAADVTDETAVQSTISQLLEQEGRIDVLLCCAGFGISGTVEHTDIADTQKQFDVNYFGALRCIRAVLPAMRKQRDGCILLVSSVAGALSIPFQAHCSATKSALNALSLALQNEVRPYGIRVAALLPGDIKTGFTAAREKTAQGADVYPALPRSIERMERDEQNGMPPECIAKALYRLSRKKHPAPFSTVGLQYRFFLFLQKILPARVYNFIVGMLYA